MDIINYILSNPLITAGGISWATAQIIKTIINLCTQKTFDKKKLTSAGGMPSSHTAIVCSVLLTSLFEYGYQSEAFGLSFILAIIVMYDATGVRWEAGLHARSINNLVDYLDDKNPHDPIDLDSVIPRLDESLGHRVIEVICGAILGLSVAFINQLVIHGNLYIG